MLLHVPGVLTADEVARARAIMAAADWQDGRATAGHQSARVKNNRQIPEGSEAARTLGDMVLAGLGRNALFLSAVLPFRVFPPLFNRYDGGMDFGNHVDNAIRYTADGVRVRTDVSATLFLSGPEEYDGGELVVDDSYGAHAVKLPAGDMVVYPASSLHRVTPVTRGARLASFFWIQSMVREDAQRTLLFDLDQAIRGVGQALPDHPTVVMLTACYHNLLRMWSEV
ncbi:MAG: Fe2+-dependent dioxygenase [Alphaproteobacteria bacterium]